MFYGANEETVGHIQQTSFQIGNDMANKNRRGRKNRRKRVRSRRTNSTQELANQAAPESKTIADSDEVEEHGGSRPSALTHAIRLTGIAPIVLLVVSLALYVLFPRYVPYWFQPIVDKEVAVLTLSAGHATIISLLISYRGRFTWSTFALFIAAIATALAGIRTIGDSTPGQVVALMLLLLTGPAVWAEWLGAKTLRIWRLAGIRGITSAVLLVVFVILVTYNQARDENYIRNWILIPMLIFTGIVIGACILWLLLRLIYRFTPIAFGWVCSIVGAAYRRLFDTTGSLASSVRSVLRSGRPRMRDKPSSRARRVVQ